MRVVSAFLALFALASLGAAVEWADTPLLTSMWSTISSSDNNGLLDILISNPDAADARSADGRGALFWAYEFGSEDALAMLLLSEPDEDIADQGGQAPSEFLASGDPKAFRAKAAAKMASFKTEMAERAVALQKEQEEMERRAREMEAMEANAVERSSEYFEEAAEYSDDEDWEAMQARAREEAKEEL